MLVQESKLEIVYRKVMAEISGFARPGWILLPSRGAATGVIFF